MVCSIGFDSRPYQTMTTNHRFVWAVSRPYKSIFRNHEKGQKIAVFFNPRRSSLAATQTHSMVAAFFSWFLHTLCQSGFKPATSPSRTNSSTTAPHDHSCLQSILVPHILYKIEHKLIVWGPKLIQMKKLSTIKFYNFSRSTTFILVVSPSEAIYKICILNWRNSNVVFHGKMISNEKVINYKVS